MMIIVRTGETLVIQFEVPGSEELIEVKASAWESEDGRSGAYLVAYTNGDSVGSGTIWEKTFKP